MQKFAAVNDIFDFAIAQEEDAEQFYLALAARMQGEHMQKVFQDFAIEEQKHKKKLLAAKTRETALLTDQMVLDLNMNDYLVDLSDRFQIFEHQDQPLNYQQALIFAMKKEKAAFKLYTNLAEKTEDADFRNMFQALAQEEAKHKLRLEMEYNTKFLEEI
jgi:rubrerythrin